MINNQDLPFIAYVVCSLILAWLFMRWARSRWKQLLTTAELKLAAKLLGIALMLLLIIAARNSLALPEEMFIYGRF